MFDEQRIEEQKEATKELEPGNLIIVTRSIATWKYLDDVGCEQCKTCVKNLEEVKGVCQAHDDLGRVFVVTDPVHCDCEDLSVDSLDIKRVKDSKDDDEWRLCFRESYEELEDHL